MGLPAAYAALTPDVVAAADAARPTTYAPFGGQPLADLPVSTPADVARAYDGARAAQQGRATTSLRERILKYAEAQTVAVQRLAGFAPPPSVSWDQWAKGFTVSLRALTALRRR